MKRRPAAAWLFVGTVLPSVVALFVALGPPVVRQPQWIALVALVALLFSYRAYRASLAWSRDPRHLLPSELHLATVEALARAIDAKDQTPPGHIRRVQVYAAGVARALGVPESEIQGVKTAALLHDIGKLAVPEHILSKPGPLTQQEFQKIRIHPQIGAEIISAVPFPYPVAPFILSHHERWDGRGYPLGLKGDEIPLGARILGVADYFDALTSERPYHKAVSHDAALDLLKEERGKAFDPHVVDVFVGIHRTLIEEVESNQDWPRRSTFVSGPLPDDAALPSIDRPATNVFEDIALAQREIYALYEIAQAMGATLGVSETMALLASKLTKVVPYSCCAMYLYLSESETVQCRFASGVSADVIKNFAIRAGLGPTGWVAHNRRPLINGDPSADFDAAGFSAAQTPLRSALVYPLTADDRFVGAIALYHIDASAYTEDHRRLLDRVAEQAAAVLSNSLAFEKTLEDSLTDSLTALPNTRFLAMHLSRELARASRLNAEVALLVLDLDNFKDINDTFGHRTGDRALRQIATVLRAAIRPYDICVRYAGDEFIVVLAGCGRDEAERKRLELQEAVDSIRFEVRTGEMVPLAISAGAAIFPHDGSSHESMISIADSRMYRDKMQRRAAAAERSAVRRAMPPEAEDSRRQAVADAPGGAIEGRGSLDPVG
jgi:diguanylate cyclase (GGDEF)-like protein/putative nucleotidyltransferase with HDIG domain